GAAREGDRPVLLVAAGGLVGGDLEVQRAAELPQLGGGPLQDAVAVAGDLATCQDGMRQAHSLAGNRPEGRDQDVSVSPHGACLLRSVGGRSGNAGPWLVVLMFFYQLYTRLL